MKDERACHAEQVDRAISEGDAERVRQAVLLGFDINASLFHCFGGLGGAFTAPWVATMLGRNRVLEVLLGAGGDPNTANEADGKTLLHEACFRSHVETISVLLSHGAHPHHTDHEGMTPLMEAAMAGKGTVRALVEGSIAQRGEFSGVNTMTKAIWGRTKVARTALDFAIRWGSSLDAVTYLRDLGALRARDLRKRAPTARKQPKSATKTGLPPQIVTQALQSGTLNPIREDQY